MTIIISAQQKHNAVEPQRSVFMLFGRKEEDKNVEIVRIELTFTSPEVYFVSHD